MRNAFTVKELIAELSKIADQNAEVFVDTGAVDLPVNHAPQLKEYTNKDGIKVSYVLL